MGGTTRRDRWVGWGVPARWIGGIVGSSAAVLRGFGARNGSVVVLVKGAAGMKMKLLLLMGVLWCGSTVRGGYLEIGEGEYGYGIVLRNNDSLLVTGGGADAIEARDFSSVEIRATAPLRQFVGGIYDMKLFNMTALKMLKKSEGVCR